MLKRLALFACGLITAQMGRVFGSFEHSAPAEADWLAFYAVLFCTGILAIVVSLVPVSLLRRVRPDFTEERRFALGFLIAFAAAGFVTTVVLGMVPARLNPSMNAVYLVCPACIVTATVDPPLSAVIVGLAPLNAAIFGSFGAVLSAGLRWARY